MHTDSGLLAVVFATASIMIMLLMAIIYRRMPRFEHLLAAVIGFTGVGIIFAPLIDFGGGITTTLILCLIGTLVFSTGSIISASNQKIGLPVMASNCWGMAYGAVYLGLTSLIRGHEFIIEPSVTYIGGLIWLAVVLCRLVHRLPVACRQYRPRTSRLRDRCLSGLCPDDFVNG